MCSSDLFLEEYSHSSAPEVFLAACSQRTKNIRLGHGVVLTAPGYNHPARVAERVATLDLVSNGRVDFGTGESASRAELEGYRVVPAERRAMGERAQACFRTRFAIQSSAESFIHTVEPLIRRA